MIDHQALTDQYYIDSALNYLPCPGFSGRKGIFYWDKK
jgi:hypothetical protein